MLVKSRIRMVGAARCFHAGKVFAIAGSIAPEHNHTFAGVLSRPPIPIVLMIADRLRQSVLFPKKIDRSGLTVTVGENRSCFALLWREFVINSSDFPRHFFPSKLIGEMLRQWTGRLVLGLGGLKAHHLLIT